MSTSTLAHLRAANIPWLQHITVLASTFYFFAFSEVRTFLILYGLTAFLFDTEALLAALQDPTEPPLIPHPYLPFLGHVIGMFWYGASYFARVNAKTQYPIFTLQTLTARTIAVIDPVLAAPIQRASKNLSFYGMILEVTKRLVDFDEQSMEIIRFNLDGEHGSSEGLMNESQEMIASELSPGRGLNQLSTTQLDKFSELLSDLVRGTSTLEISLMDFVKRIFTIANAYTIYGPQNPFAMHPELVHKFWDYESGMIAVMANVFPFITARKPWLARKAINEALQEFVEKGYYRTASTMIQKRVQINLKHGLTTKMAGRAELILLFGVIGNAVPTTFWFLANVFGRPALLQKIRIETSQAISSTRSRDGKVKEKIINVTDLKTKCPLLVSTYRETLRTIANLASVRLVTNTHSVSAPGHPPYLLKKGSMIQIASGVIHGSESVWGADANSFNPTRFISSTTSSEQFSSETGASISAERTATALPKNVPSAAYRAFGGGSVICPGRHFAQSEILGFVALCVQMLDIEDVKGGTFDVPERDDQRIPLSVMKPVKEPQVVVKRRKGEEDVIWRLEL
ncbi:cytochrome P450 [Trematosphaeria pertusa]|uniref:Cytochrome P450 n=1 Tax=Trematosphaeria pertusa TaxID=390896 RepID=A0A6A6I9Q5_9PLEO|nr:cytochrome P450 [Trematosphaeria pertusa]KAF2247101.1 cytochrome P450 [Trematosphaeria pertusa]